MKTTTTCPIEARITADATEYSDRELHDRYDSMLDDCYSFAAVGGLFSGMEPSRVLKECDETAYRCGFNDWLDSERDQYVEIGSEYYDRGEAETALEAYRDELQADLDEKLEDGDADEDAIEALKTLVAEAKDYSL